MIKYILCLSLFVIACQHTDILTEPVMVDGMQISFVKGSERITIRAEGRYGRRYIWAGGSRACELYPRRYRWYGSLGLYHPSKMWPEHNGIRRAILEEGQRHFVSEESAREWLKKQVAYGDTLYTDRGLVIQWCKSYPQSSSPKSSHGVLHARVWQIYIHGKRPEYRDGYADDIIVRYPDDYPFFEVIPPSKEIDHWSAQ